MTPERSDQSIEKLRRDITAKRKELRLAVASMQPDLVPDYLFAAHGDEIRLSTLFAGMSDLIVIHNMGSSCAFCTLWADGYNGLYPHIRSRAAFVISSPDPPELQQSFATERGWRFPMVSHQGTTFAHDMGFATKQGTCRPGLSAFQLREGRIYRVERRSSEPFDDYCAVWHLFDLFPEGPGTWSPKLNYV